MSKLRKRSMLLLQVAVGGLALYWVISVSHVSVDEVVAHILNVSWPLLILGIVCFVASMFLGALRYFLFLPFRVPFQYLLGVTLFQNALVTLIPWRIGELGYPLLLRRDWEIPIASSVTVIVGIRVTDLFIVLAVALVAGLQLQLAIGWVSFLLIGMIMLSGALLLSLPYWRMRAPAWLQTILAALLPLRQPKRLISLLVLSGAMFFLTTLQSMFILQAMGLGLSAYNVALLNALTLLVALLPIHPPGGWGTIDSVQVFVLERLGYSAATALPSILAAHSFYTLIILAGGIAGWLLRVKGRPVSQPGISV